MIAKGALVLLLCTVATAGTSAAADWIERPAMDTSVRPQDDFYRYVNGGWLKETRIPDDLPWISPYVVNYLKVQDRLGAIIREAANTVHEAPSDEQRLGDAYRSYMDTGEIEARGLKPLDNDVAAIRGIKGAESLAERFAAFNRWHAMQTDLLNRQPVPFYIAARPDDRDARHIAAILRPGGLGMSNRESYISDDPRQVTIREAYLAHIERTLALADVHDAADKAKRILALETRLAAARLSLTAQMDHAANYNHLTREQLQDLMPAFPWVTYLQAAGLSDVQSFVVSDKAYFSALNRILTDTSLEDWKGYLTWQLLRVNAPYLPEKFVTEDFDFFGRVEMGSQAQMPRSDRAVALLQGNFSDTLGKLYVARYFPPEDKVAVTCMTEAIRDQFRQSIQRLDWLSPEGKAAAQDKLERMLIKVAYPDQWADHDGLVIRPDDLIGNLMRINAAAYDRAVAEIGGPVDRGRWQTPVYATSAYYYRVTNELAVPAGYLLPPWYESGGDAAMNYGGIGTVIGHEMGHAFDNQGSQYDGEGNLRDWWSAEDRRQFETLTGRLVAQYDGYTPRPGLHVDGKLTLSENIGDLTGLTMAYRAFKAQSEGKGNEDGFTADQRFFISFASHWRALYRDALMTRILTSDGHSPQEFRATGPLSNFEPFYRAFDVAPGDGMYRPEVERVSIW